MKKYLLLAGVVTLLAGGSFVAEKSFLAASVANPAVSGTVTNESPGVKPLEIENKVNVPQTQTPSNPAAHAPAPTAVATQTPNITLVVEGHSYTTFAPAGATVLDAMRTLASTSDFTFTGRDYPSLGFFVESINGQKAEAKHTWILYVNGKLSGTGASQTTLKAGDSVEWKYEKSY